jgi:FAD/FMN-containing dehydrogenase
MSQREDLVKIVGTENVFDDPKTLEEYGKDESFVHPMRPRYVVKPRNAEEVQGIVRWANETLTPLVPVSSGSPHFRGDTVPSAGGVVVDLTRMKRVLRVDRPNRVAMVEPGVTFGEVIPALEKEGLGAYLPLVPRSTKSVVGSMLEREPITMPRHHWDAQDPLLCIEVVFGTGDVFRTGSAAGMGTLEEQWKVGKAQLRPMGPSQADLQRVVQGSQGTMGIVTWATMKCRLSPEIKKVFLVASRKLEPLIDLSYRLLRIPLGDECLILNDHSLASLMAKGAGGVVPLREGLPSWVLFLSIEGYGVLPEEKVAYQEGDFRAMAQQVGVEPVNKVGGVMAEEVAEVLSKPSAEPYWKLKFKGGSHDLFFITTLDRSPDFVKAMYGQAEACRYPVSDIGVYIQPMVQGCSCHCEFTLSCDRNSPQEVEKVKGLVTGWSTALANMGGFFSRPYGAWADVAYRRDAETTAALRKVKGIFDANNIMNPGKLCF